MSRGKGDCIWHSLCTYTIRNPRRRVPTMRRNFVETGGHHAKSFAGWPADAHLTQYKMGECQDQASSGRGFGHRCSWTTWSILRTTAWAPPCCFHFLSSVSFKGWLAVGQLRSAALVVFSRLWKNAIVTNYGSQIRVERWPLSGHKDIFHLSFCLLSSFLSTCPWQRGDAIGNPQAKTRDTQGLALYSDSS